MLQRDIFLQGEGKAWLTRNRDKLGQHDPVSELIEAQGIKPKSVLEIGCADGWRLKKLEAKYGCHVEGIEPSSIEIMHNAGGFCIHKATAEEYDTFIPKNSYDLVIFGFCLYLCDPCDYFRIVAESDRVLQDGGHLIIHDFDATNEDPWKTPYEHKQGVWSHHYHFPALWRAHPAYQGGNEYWRKVGDGSSVWLLRKDMTNAFAQR